MESFGPPLPTIPGQAKLFGFFENVVSILNLSLFSQRSPIGSPESKNITYFFFIKCRGERPVNGNFPLKHIFFYLCLP